MAWFHRSPSLHREAVLLLKLAHKGARLASMGMINLLVGVRQGDELKGQVSRRGPTAIAPGSGDRSLY